MILTNLKPQVKGTSLVNARKYIISELGDTRYRQLCNDHKFPGLILSSSWYDMSTYVKLCQTAAKLMGMNIHDFMVGLGRYILEVDLNGVYRFFMKARGTEAVLSKVPKMMSSYTDYWSGEIIEIANNSMIINYQFPAHFKDESELMKFHLAGGEGALQGILNVCGSPMISFDVVNTYQLGEYYINVIRVTFMHD